MLYILLPTFTWFALQALLDVTPPKECLASSFFTFKIMCA